MNGSTRERRRQFFIGVLLSTIPAGFFAIFLMLWRVVPDWTIGCWSLRTQYAMTSVSSLDDLLQRYHRVLDQGYAQALYPHLIACLRDATRSREEHAAILRFCCLRVGRYRAVPELFTLGPEWIGAVLEATDHTDVETRHGAVLFMEGLNRRQNLFKPFIQAASDGPAAGLGKEDVVLRAYAAFFEWWSLPPAERAERDPLSGTGITILEP